MKKITWIIALALLAACTQKTAVPPKDASSSSSYTSSASTTSNHHLYTSKEAGFSIEYPNDITIKEKDELITDDMTIVGTAFVFPASYSMTYRRRPPRMSPSYSSASSSDRREQAMSCAY